MILVVGGTGVLGGLTVTALRARGAAVRVLTRDVARAGTLRAAGVDCVVGDLCDPETLPAALRSVDAVVCTAHGTDGSGTSGPKAVDGLGVRNLVEAAGSDVRSFVYVSSASAALDSPADVFRFKAQAEKLLTDGPLPYVIVRPTHLMDTWGRMLGEALVVKKQRMVFGRGANPVSFVAGSDIAQALATSALTPGDQRSITLAGPEALSLSDVLDLIEREFGVTSTRTMRVPLGVLRAMSSVAGPFNEVRGRQMRLGALLESRPQVVDSGPEWARLRIRPLTFAAWLAENHDSLERGWPGSAAAGPAGFAQTDSLREGA